ncbi:MAG: hypothetical protein WCZ23_09610 [Rhodospirillaceae bacterium]
MTGAVALVAGLTAACEDAPRSTTVYLRPQGIEPFLAGITAHGPLLVETMDTGFAEDRDVIGPMVASAVVRGIQGRVVQATHEPGAASHPDFRVRVAFDAPEAFNPNRLCAGEVPASDTGRDRLHVLAVFCQGEVLHAAVVGSVPRPDTLTHDSVGRLLTQMAQQMFASPAAP